MLPYTEQIIESLGLTEKERARLVDAIKNEIAIQIEMKAANDYIDSLNPSQFDALLDNGADLPNPMGDLL